VGTNVVFFKCFFGACGDPIIGINEFDYHPPVGTAAQHQLERPWHTLKKGGVQEAKSLTFAAKDSKETFGFMIEISN